MTRARVSLVEHHAGPVAPAGAVAVLQEDGRLEALRLASIARTM